MSNYVYIIAGLPDFTPDWRQGEKSLDEYIGQVRELLSEKDNEVLDFIVKGFDKDQIGPELYREALSHRLGFIREFFQFDLNVRNQKVRYLNQALGRDPERMSSRSGILRQKRPALNRRSRNSRSLQSCRASSKATISSPESEALTTSTGTRSTKSPSSTISTLTRYSE